MSRLVSPSAEGFPYKVRLFKRRDVPSLERFFLLFRDWLSDWDIGLFISNVAA